MQMCKWLQTFATSCKP